MAKVPEVYRREVAGEAAAPDLSIADDEHCLAQLKDYRSLMPLAQEARRPMFLLEPGDGAIGGHQAAVTQCWSDFRHLARRIAQACGVPLPP